MRRAVDVSLPAFISYVHATSSLVDAIASLVNRLAITTHLVEAGTVWAKLFGATGCPTAKFSLKQRSWDEPICKDNFKTLLEESNQVEKSGLLPAAHGLR